MATKPVEATREPGTSTLQGPVIGDANYQRSGSRVPPGGNVRLNAGSFIEPEVEAEVEADESDEGAEAE